MSIELKPCPFCGSTDIDPEGVASFKPEHRTAENNWNNATPDKIKHFPACNNCSATTNGDWNTRVVGIPTAKQPDASPYKKFFDKIWTDYCDGNMEIAELVTDVALKYGLAKEEKYDPQIHGEALGSEWGLEDGDPCYVLAKLPKRE